MRVMSFGRLEFRGPCVFCAFAMSCGLYRCLLVLTSVFLEADPLMNVHGQVSCFGLSERAQHGVFLCIEWNPLMKLHVHSHSTPERSQTCCVCVSRFDIRVECLWV